MYKKILVVVDERKASQTAIRLAIEMASVHRADILFFYVSPHFTLPGFDIIPVAELSPEEFQKESLAQAHRTMAAASDLAERAGVQSYRSICPDVHDAKNVAKAATKKRCDLIVVGTENSNAVMRILNGSIVPGLISLATVPVLVCRETMTRNKIGQTSRGRLRTMKARLEHLEQRRRVDHP